MKRRVATLLLLALAVYAALCAALYFGQRRLIYAPGPPAPFEPGSAWPGGRGLELTTRDGERVHAWFLPASTPAGGARAALLHCHGNAGNLADRLDAARDFAAMGLDVLLFDYRGYGRSTGTPGEEGTYLDAEAAHAWLTGVVGVDARRIVLYGESLGVAVAVELARRRPAAALIAESGFVSVPELGARLYPFLPVRWLARYAYDNRAKIGALETPVLLIHSPADEIVPYEHARELQAVARAPGRLLVTAGAHNEGGFRLRPEWRAEVAAFVEAALARPR